MITENHGDNSAHAVGAGSAIRRRNDKLRGGHRAAGIVAVVAGRLRSVVVDRRAGHVTVVRIRFRRSSVRRLVRVDRVSRVVRFFSRSFARICVCVYVCVISAPRRKTIFITPVPATADGRGLFFFLFYSTYIPYVPLDFGLISKKIHVLRPKSVIINRVVEKRAKVDGPCGRLCLCVSVRVCGRVYRCPFAVAASGKWKRTVITCPVRSTACPTSAITSRVRSPSPWRWRRQSRWTSAWT